MRTKKIIGDQAEEYEYDGNSHNLVLEMMRTGSDIQLYHYYQWDPNGHVVGMVVKDKDASGNWQTTPYYFLTNGRGDVVQIVNQSGDKVGAYTYDAYGNVLSENGAIAKDNDVRYASYTYDSETQHYYLKARYYDPQNGNFLAMDPHPGDDDDPISQNGYTYAENNPMTKIDPEGTNPLLFASAGGALSYAGGISLMPGIGWIIGGAIVGGVLVVGGYYYFKSHSKNTRPSNWNKHTKPRPGRNSEKKKQKPGWKKRR